MTLSATQIPYQPPAKIFWIRIAQVVLTVVVIICAAVANSKSWAGQGMLGFTFYTIGWTLIWMAVATFGMPRAPASCRPVIIVIVFETLSMLFWLGAFSTIGRIAAVANETAKVYESYHVEAFAPDSKDVYTGGVGALIAAALFGAVNWILFCMTAGLIAFTARRQRIQHQQEMHQANGNPNLQNAPYDPIQTDKP